MMEGHPNVHDVGHPNVDGAQPDVGDNEPNGSNGEAKSRSRKRCIMGSEWGRNVRKGHETKGWSTQP